MINHIAIIMDGNRRWARARHLPVLAGHKKVLDDVLEPLIEYAAKIGVKYLTFWAWSTENWQRDKNEVAGIMKLFKNQLKNKGIRLHEKGIRVKIIGDISRFDPVIKKEIDNLVELTKNNTNITVIFALNYGGRDELLRAFGKFTKEYPMSNIKFQILNDNFANFLDTKDIPDPEMIVRTGGERRLSGFLLWQCQYSELFFPEFFMPDFTPDKLDEIIKEFKHRQRRFGR